MLDKTKFTVSHAPFWHDGDSIATMNKNIMLAAAPAALWGIKQFGMPALAVICFSISTAIIWEALFNMIAKRSQTTGDFSAAVIGLLFAMMLPATTPWWVVLTGTFVSVVVGKMIYGGIGGNPFSPPIVGVSILMVSWKNYFDFDTALVNYEFSFKALAPLTALKQHGTSAVEMFPISDLIFGNQVGAIGSTFGIGLIIGGLYLIIRGYIRWEITVAYLAGIFVTAICFNMADPGQYAGPLFHIFTGYTLLGAIFLATEDSSSPVNFIPMIIYGLLGGFMTILIRNIGAYPDGTVLAILLINLCNPLIDRIRPKALGKGVNNG